MRLSTLAIACLGSILALPAAPSTVRAQDGDPLRAALEENAHPIVLHDDGTISGAGATLLIEGGRDAQFFLIGEEHGVGEVPLLAAALFRELAPYGYRHLAIETGEVLAAGMNRALLADDPDRALAAFLSEYWPGAPFYTAREEAALLRVAVEAAGGENVLWGLDYDIMADRYALRRLRDLAPDEDARRVAERAIATADSLLDAALSEKNPGLVFMFGGPETFYPELREAYDPEPGSEADRIITLMEETRAINGLFMQGRGLESNRMRGRLNKRTFMDLFRAAWHESGEPPRVMFKFGANHTTRGRSATNVFDIGTLASVLADGLGSRSFGVVMAAGDGSMRSMMDPTRMEYVDAPADYYRSDWARPFFDAADPDRWTVFDLRPLRAPLVRGDLGEAPAPLEGLIWGYDAFVVLSGSGSSHPLDGFGRPATE